VSVTTGSHAGDDGSETLGRVGVWDGMHNSQSELIWQKTLHRWAPMQLNAFYILNENAF